MPRRQALDCYSCDFCTVILRGVFAFAFVSALLFSIISAGAQTTPQARLYAVNQNGSRNFSASEVAMLSGLQKGADVDRDAIQAAADRLARSGVFSSVRYQFATDANGLIVTFQLEDAPLFAISLDNMPWISSSDLSSALNAANIPFHGAAPANGTFNDQIAQQLQKMLAAKNIHATVSHAVSATPGTTDQIVQFTAAGTNLKLASLQFSDALAAHDSSIQAALSTIKGQPFSISAIERFDFTNVRPVYLSHSYLQAQFGAPAVQVSGDDAQVTVPITPGAAYVWGGITWSGNHAYTTADLNALVTGAGLANGQPADGTKIEAMWKSVREAYGHRGYIQATVAPKENFDAASHAAAYTVNISEGEQFHMGKLVLSGLSIDAERRLRAAWKLPEGQVFDQTYTDFFLSKGAADALKGLPAAQDKMGYYLQTNSQQHTIDVMIDFE